MITSFNSSCRAYCIPYLVLYNKAPRCIHNTTVRSQLQIKYCISTFATFFFYNSVLY